MPVKLSFTLPVSIWKEDDQFVAWTPALELSTCADDEEGLMIGFEEAVRTWFEVAVERNVLDELLEECGWEKVNNNWECHFAPASGSRSLPLNISIN